MCIRDRIRAADSRVSAADLRVSAADLRISAVGLPISAADLLISCGECQRFLQVTKKNLADFLLSAAPDDLKEEHGMSKGAIKKKPKDFWLECYAVYLRTQSGAGGEQ
eukprot:TRINITY_DN21136_c0_g1_i1.p1 TRINITY_DN21136_c0_g1~~TRINITY_DN21136_c0_g1_i1.p1  ORF type:complete len:108 (+),score=30.01 TRINITY_DN21136_c0_g1_i1:148-471(+)